jgi:hypothetical protein
MRSVLGDAIVLHVGGGHFRWAVAHNRALLSIERETDEQAPCWRRCRCCNRRRGRGNIQIEITQVTGFGVKWMDVADGFLARTIVRA